MIISDYKKCRGCGKYFKNKDMLDLGLANGVGFMFPGGMAAECCQKCKEEFFDSYMARTRKPKGEQK